ncbi:FAD-binding protein [Prauserella shujinwangii]|uniref:FAD-binding protein n=1 Tax=Prauserella shujinwangii TaxID=1453103 RepID=UPI0015E610FE|nr:FAD-binding protein [Prauserella shujinwangii]
MNPPLRGRLLTGGQRPGDSARDLGRLVHRRPAAVLRPGCVDDIARMVAWCHDQGVPVAAQGTGHTTQGQRLAEGGLAVDMTTLNKVHAHGGDGVDVEAGILWTDLVRDLAGRGFRFAGGLTGYVSMTVGGTLSVGGISPHHRLGAQIDAVRRIQVVTGRGETVWASDEENPELFAAALGGLGQVGIITRVVLDLAPLPRRVHTWAVPCGTVDAAFSVMRAAIERGVLDEVYCMILPPGAAGPGPTFLVQLAYYETERPLPGDGLPCWDGPAERETLRYVEHATKYTRVIDQWREAGWDDRCKPWFDVFLPDDAAESFVDRTLAAMTPEDWSAPHGEGFVLLFPHRAGAFGRPRLRLPRQDPDRLVWLFDVLNASPADADPGYVERMLDRNRAWLGAATAAGGAAYPIGSHVFGAAEWRRHYGDTWADVVAAKKRHDPRLILTPGPGINAALSGGTRT